MTTLCRHAVASLLLVGAGVACAGLATTRPAGRAVISPPILLKLPAFYAKYVDADGVAVIASKNVPDAALAMAADQIGHMLVNRPDLRQALANANARVAVIGKDEVTTDIPEHSGLTPKAFWDQRARGLGGTVWIPTTSCAEENLLGYEKDRYAGENILIHEFAHAIDGIALAAVDSTFAGRLKDAYDRAIAKGLWARTYAATNAGEYWAEGVQSYFDCNRRADPPDGIHNAVRTRESLRAYDPDLFALIDDVFVQNPWRWTPNGAHARKWTNSG